MSPQQSDTGDYEVRLTVGDSTIVGASVSFSPAPGVPAIFEFSIEEGLFKIPEQHVPPGLASASSEYWAFSIVAGSPLGANTKPTPVDGDGTLATLTFEVIAAKPGLIHLLEPNLADTDDAPLVATVQNGMITVNASGAP